MFLNAWNDQVLAYARMTPEKDNCVLVLANLDPRNRQECTYEVPLWEFGLPDQAAIEAEDLSERQALHAAWQDASHRARSGRAAGRDLALIPSVTNDCSAHFR